MEFQVSKNTRLALISIVIVSPRGSNGARQESKRNLRGTEMLAAATTTVSRRRLAKVKPARAHFVLAPSLAQVVGVALFFVQKPRGYSRATATAFHTFVLCLAVLHHFAVRCDKASIFTKKMNDFHTL